MKLREAARQVACPIFTELPGSTDFWSNALSVYLRFRLAAALIERFGSPPAAGQGPSIGLDDALKPEVVDDG
jgi:hypothetical protein